MKLSIQECGNQQITQMEGNPIILDEDGNVRLTISRPSKRRPGRLPSVTDITMDDVDAFFE
jgi:hypothetical protein